MCFYETLGKVPENLRWSTKQFCPTLVATETALKNKYLLIKSMQTVCDNKQSPFKFMENRK